MNKEELVKQYADKKLSENPRNVYKKLPLGMQKSLTNFDGYDIEQAYEDGFDKAVGEILKWLRNNYRNYMHNPTGEKLEAFFGGDMITDLEKELEEEV